MSRFGPASRLSASISTATTAREELTEALAAGIGRIVVDNFHELDTLAGCSARTNSRFNGVQSHVVPIWLRLSPGVAAHTHAHIQTGHLDTKFGLSIATGDAEQAVSPAMQTPGVELVGLHCHIGSHFTSRSRWPMRRPCSSRSPLRSGPARLRVRELIPAAAGACR